MPTIVKKYKKTNRQVEQDWSAFIKNYLSDTSAELNETPAERKVRVSRLEKNPEEWFRYYFNQYYTSAPAPFHLRATGRILRNPEWYECRVWARELGKDARCMMETIYQALTGQKKVIILISNSKDNAVDLLKPYRTNLERNQRIINDYGKQESEGSWKESAFTTTGGVAFYAFGAGQSPRGKRNEELRPDKVIVSDIDTDENVRNPDLIKEKWAWFEKAVYGTRSVSKATQYIFLNNLMAKDCCMSRAMKMADKVDRVNLMDEEGNSTWPTKNTNENIARIKKSISTAAFQAEYMNNPLTEGSVFKEMKWGKVPQLRQLQSIIAYGDPSVSNKTRTKSSRKAVFLIGLFKGNYYVYTGYLDNAKQSDFVDWFYALKVYVGERTQLLCYIENNSLQDPFYEQVFIPLFKQRQKTKGFLGITPDTRKKPEKFTRIEGNLDPLNRMGQLIFNEREKENPHMKRLEEEFLLLTPRLRFPADGADCIEGGVWVAKQNAMRITEDSIVIGKRTHGAKHY